MKWLTNTYDPKRHDARMHLALHYHEMLDVRARNQAWQRHLEWLSDKIIGDPQPSEAYTVEQMKEMGMVGVYMREKGDSQ